MANVRKGDKIEASEEIGSMLRNARPVLELPIKFPDHRVMLLERSDKCLQRNEHEPRRWMVCFFRAGRTSQTFSNISFHNRCGGSEGGLAQMGKLTKAYTEGLY